MIKEKTRTFLQWDLMKREDDGISEVELIGFC